MSATVRSIMPYPRQPNFTYYAQCKEHDWRSVPTGSKATARRDAEEHNRSCGSSSIGDSDA